MYEITKLRTFSSAICCCHSPESVNEPLGGRKKIPFSGFCSLLFLLLFLLLCVEKHLHFEWWEEDAWIAGERERQSL